jgi:hypothetical protein
MCSKEHTPRIPIDKIVACTIREDYYRHSPTNEEMIAAASIVVDWFWVVRKQTMDVTVELLDED